MQHWLYDLSERMTALTETLETFSDDTETSKDISDAIQSVYGSEVIPAVQDGIAYIKGQIAEIDAISEQIKRLQELKKVRENRVKRVREGYKDFMKAIGKKKIETSLGNMTVALSPSSIVVDDVGKLLPQYTSTKIEVKPNLTAIKQALKAGIEVEGTHLEDKETLRIK